MNALKANNTRLIEATPLQQQLLSAVDNGELQGQLIINEPMSRYTTWRVGGEAECCYQPKSVEDLQNLMQLVPQPVAVYWIGLGSNVLIRDGGLKGLVINTNGVLNQMDIQCYSGDRGYSEDKGNSEGSNKYCIISAEAGLSCAVFSRKAANKGLNGAEFLSGIPGTIGGALAMNAGAFGGETWRQVISVDTIDRNGIIHHRTPDKFEIAYRKVTPKNSGQMEWFVRGQFRYEQNPQALEQSKQQIKSLLQKRAETQPTRQANAGSVFKNPQGDYSARLIEDCGLKGRRIGGAQVSEKHANFIINTGQATAQDIENLIRLVQEQVYNKHKITLETEVRIMGELMSEEWVKQS